MDTFNLLLCPFVSAADDLDQMLETSGGRGASASSPQKPYNQAFRPPTPPRGHKQQPKEQSRRAPAVEHYAIETDPLSKEIFGESLDELNDALRQLSAIGQLGLNTEDEDG